MTIKATGYTWYWGYEYPDHGDFQFDAIMLQEDELEDDQQDYCRLIMHCSSINKKY